MTKVVKTNTAIAAMALSPIAKDFSNKLDALVNDGMKAIPGEIVAAIMAYTIGEMMSDKKIDSDDYSNAISALNSIILHGTHDAQAALRRQGGRVQ